MSMEFDYHPERTVPGRVGPSVLSRFLTEGNFAEKLNAKRILDFGCGRGIDIPHYKKFGYEAVGYDPYPPFGFSEYPTGKFDLVIIAFVLNVLPGNERRIAVIKRAAEFMDRGSNMILVTRSERSVNRIAAQKQWEKHRDGFWSSKSRGMFQKGLSKSDLRLLADLSGLGVHPLDGELKPDYDTSYLLVTKNY